MADWVRRGRLTGRQLREQLADETWLDELIDRAESGGVQLTGEGGFLPELVKAVLERGPDAELTDHLGYERGDPAGREVAEVIAFLTSPAASFVTGVALPVDGGVTATSGQALPPPHPDA